MSVVEFFINYWDWYLLITSLFMVAILNSDAAKFLDAVDILLASVFWPVVLIARLM